MPSTATPNTSTAATDVALAVDGLRLHARRSGPGDAPAVVVLHGIMGHAREWDPLTERLADRFQVLAVDQRGHGRSDWADVYTADRFGRDVVEIVEALGTWPVDLVGHSLGAMAAAIAAARRPDLVRRLVMIDIGPDSLHTPFAAELPGFIAGLASVSYAEPAEAVAEWLAGNPLAREDRMRHYVEHCLVAGPDGRYRWRFDGAGLARFPVDGVSSAELWRAVDRLAAPTLLVRGALSPLVSRPAAEAVVRRLRDGRAVEIPGGGHDLGVEQPEAVTDAVLDFLGPAGRQ